MKKLRDIVLQNWGLKVTAVVLAGILWLAVHGEPVADRSMEIPLEIRNIPRNMEITSERPTTVTATLRGSTTTLWFGQSVPVCVVDLESSGGEGERIIPLGPDNVRIPRVPGFQVLSVRPARIRLFLERTISKEVPIVAATEGKPADGFEVYSITPIPAKTLLTGPRSSIDRMDKVQTETISLSAQSGSMRTFVNLNIRDAMVYSSPAQPVQVIIEIGVRRKVTTVARVPVTVEQKNLSVTPAYVMLHVWVPLTFKDKLAPGDFAVTVQVPDEGSEVEENVLPNISFTRPLDPTIRIKEIVPPTVKVKRKNGN